MHTHTHTHIHTHTQIGDVACHLRGAGYWNGGLLQIEGAGFLQVQCRMQCMKIITEQEEKRGFKYKYIITTRSDLKYVLPHPPIALFEESSAHNPFSNIRCQPNPTANKRGSSISTSYSRGKQQTSLSEGCITPILTQASAHYVFEGLRAHHGNVDTDCGS
jgi:hypothetical protein